MAHYTSAEPHPAATRYAPAHRSHRTPEGSPSSSRLPPTTPQLDDLMAEIQETLDDPQLSPQFAGSGSSWSPPRHNAQSPGLPARTSSRQTVSPPARVASSQSPRPLPSLPKPKPSPPAAGPSLAGVDRHATLAGYRPSGASHRPPVQNFNSSPATSLATTSPTFAANDWPRETVTPHAQLSPSASPPSLPRRARSDVGSQPQSPTRQRPVLQPSGSLLARAALNVRPHDPDLQYLQPWLVSHVATFFRDRVAKGVNIKGSIEYPDSFTGKEAVSTVQSTFPPMLAGDRRLALEMTRTLHRSMFIHQVDWAESTLHDSVDDVYVLTDEDLSNPAFGSPTGEELTLLPTGVATALTQCYSPFCTRDTRDGRAIGTCYSRSCPNQMREPLLERAPSSLSTSTADPPAPTSTTWDTIVPKELLQQLDKREIARQCIIYEIISGEQEYVDDLELYLTHFVEPIKTADPAIIAPSARLDHFIRVAFSDVARVLERNRALLERMRVRQREQHPIVMAIGDVVLDAALEWGQAYVKVISDTVWGEVEVNEERVKNPALETLFQDLPRKTPRRSDFRHFLTRAGARLQRYPLLLENLVKKTPGGNEGEEEHPDRAACQAALDIIREQCKEADAATAVRQNRLKLRNLSNELVPRTDTPDLHLLDEDRQICMSGKMTRRPEGGAGLSDWTDLTVWLLDHCLLMTKPKRLDDSSMRFQVSRRPIPLELVRVSGWTDPPEKKSRGIRTITGVVERGNSDLGSTGAYPGVGGADERTVYPITIYGLGRYGGTMTLCVESDRARQRWKAAFEEAMGNRAAVLDAQRVFELRPMSDQTFGSLGGSDPNQCGSPTCSVPFTAADGRTLVAIGCSTGLWIGVRNDARSLRQVLHLKGITQCSVLQEFGSLLVLADKVLIAYPLERLVPSKPGPPSEKQGASRLSGHKDVLFFKCGKVGHRTLVTYVKKSGVNQTVFKALEPVGHVERPRGGAKGLFGFGGSKNPDEFRGYKEFFIPADAYAIQYLRTTLSIHCARGFEIMNLETLKSASIPDFTQIRGDARANQLQRRCEESRPLGMFRIGDNVFLLCYADLAFFADKHGDPLPHRYNDIIEWEGSPTSVAFSPPYVVAFSPTLVEVWDTGTSRRSQVIVGSNIVCTYDAGGLGEEPGAVNAGPSRGRKDDGSRRMHVAIKGQDRRNRVFEMWPAAEAPPANGGSDGYAY